MFVMTHKQFDGYAQDVATALRPNKESNYAVQRQEKRWPQKGR